MSGGVATLRLRRHDGWVTNPPIESNDRYRHLILRFPGRNGWQALAHRQHGRERQMWLGLVPIRRRRPVVAASIRVPVLHRDPARRVKHDRVFDVVAIHADLIVPVRSTAEEESV